MLEPLIGKLNELRVVLASSSEQRAALLRATKLKFEIIPSNFEENLDPKQYTFSEFVERTAFEKMNEVWERLKNDPIKPDVIISTDTMVTYNGRMYGKPKDKADAVRTITELTQTGIPNVVYSGVVIRYKNEIRKFTEVTTVYMSKLTPKEVVAYVETGEPIGKAGGYGIQGIASTFVERIDGDGNNVIGLPLCRLAKELKDLVWKNN